MTDAAHEVFDSQILAENVGFLDNCFDNSFVLQSSLVTVKEYFKDNSVIESDRKNEAKKESKKNISLHNKTGSLDISIDLKKLSQVSYQSSLHKNLRDWGLPDEISNKYEQRGIIEMFDWQVVCLANSKVLLDSCNLVYSAPTSAGKTLVAEILTIKTILERQKKVIIILPFVSIVREKMFYLQDILSSSGIRVEGFMGSQSPPGGLQAVHIAICTIEKANSLVNRLLDDGSITDLGAVIVDELHLLGDPHRGYILELLLTKIKYISSSREDVQIQVVGMSATLPNLEILAKWLDAELFVTQFRPIPLDEYCLIGNKYYDKNGKILSELSKANNVTNDSDRVLNICLDTIKDGCSILIFCMTKNRCENLAQSLAFSFYNIGSQQSDLSVVLRNQLNTNSISEVLEQLKNCPVGLDQILKKTVSFGVAYHHAGLTFDERDIIEGGFKSGAIRVLVATSTLSSGVNLPARKVIIRTPVFQRQPINILTYKQMIGRAGRMGRDTKGESILICTDNEKAIGFELMMGALDPVHSCIESEDKYMRVVLEMIASQAVCSKTELDSYTKCTLLYTQQNISTSQNVLLEKTLEELKNYELIRVQDEAEEVNYVATSLGKACLSASMAPNDGLSLFLELQKARQCLVLETDLHLIYLVTPYSVSSLWGDIDWLHLLTLWESLTRAMKRVGELVGVQESFIIRCLRGNNKLLKAQNKMNVHKRFYTALALQDLVNEVPLSEVAAKFQCARGFLQSLQQSAATFAGMVTAFCHQLGWKNMEILVSQFQDRLHFGIHSELLELMKLPSLNGVRARALFDAGFETVSSIASSDVNVIENVLHKALPFQSEKEREDDDKGDLIKRNKIKSIWITGSCGKSPREAAQNLISEARKCLESEIGVSEIKWSVNVQNTLNNHVNVNANNNVVQNNSESIKTNNDFVANMDHKSNSSASKKEPVNVINKSPESCSDKENKMSVNSSTCENVDVFPIHKDLELKSKQDDAAVSSSKRVSIDLLDTSSEDAYVSTNVSNNIKSLSASKKKVFNKYDSLLKENVVSKTMFKHSIVNKTIATQMKATPIPTTMSPDLDFDSSPVTTEDIIWDSLNFTETAIKNITQVKTPKVFSPNISFGETDRSTPVDNIMNEKETSKHNASVKDVSIFSTDNDESNIFEESLPLDLLPSKLLDEADIPVTAIKKETTADFVNLNTNSILNVFQSPLVDDDDVDDIKLVYEDDAKTDSENEPKISLTNENEVLASQDTITFSKDFKSPYKRPLETKEHNGHSAKKKKFNQSTELRNNLLQITESVKYSLKISNHCLNCILLKGSDIYKYLSILDSFNEASIHFIIKHPNPVTEIIGNNILKIDKTDKEDDLIKGIALYLGQDICIFIDSNSYVNKTLERNTLKYWLQKDKLRLKTYALKLNSVYLKKWLDMYLPSSCFDVLLAEWLLHNDERIPNIELLMKKHCALDLATVLIKVDDKRKDFKQLAPEINACIKAWAVWMITEKQETTFTLQYGITRNLIDTESEIAAILAECEYHGITVDRHLASVMLNDVKRSQDVLQKKANKLVGCHVNLNSSKCVAKALGINRIGRVSTKKSVLSCHSSPLSSVVIYWRKLNCILTKTLYPLTEKAFIYSEGNKISPSYTMHTSTGRVSMHEPNLQNVPRTFRVPRDYLDGARDTEFNCRHIFKASPHFVMVSADYCQLEMRVLTHFSEDEVLVGIMRSDVDVFKSIAATWSQLTEDEVDEDLRQKAKQLCYGILYGMGNKTLAQHLDVTEMEAAFFMDSFYKTFPDVRKYTQRVIEECRRNDYVETLMRRRRHLPNINSKYLAARSAAERQAVNTKIQGSAADIAKAAMCGIHKEIRNMKHKPRLLLQMHDELIYEVPENNKQEFVKIMKRVMEDTVKLKVPLPVKMKCGYSWGTLQPI